MPPMEKQTGDHVKQKYDTIIKIRDELNDLHDKINTPEEKAKVKRQYWKSVTYSFIPAGFFPSREQLEAIKTVVGKERYLLDIGTGTGETGACLTYCGGLKVKCFEPNALLPCPTYLEISRLSGLKAIEANKTVSCVLALFCPTAFALDVSKHYHDYGGDVILVGGLEGRVATPQFWSWLKEHFHCAKMIPAVSAFPDTTSTQEPRPWTMVPTPLYIYLRLSSV